MKKIFIDGVAGTTGLKIHERLQSRTDLEILHIPDQLRKDTSTRAEYLNAADVAFLCLPDAASREAISLITNPNTVVIDTSTAHRTTDGWTYGFPEIDNLRAQIAGSKRIANPGCHASGFIALVQPLVASGIVSPDARLSCFSLTGYSGGGKSMIAQYEASSREAALASPRLYGLSQNHKHLPEMSKVCGLEFDPVFCPIVADYLEGMEVVVSLFSDQIQGSVSEICQAYERVYNSQSEGLVSFVQAADEAGFLAANALAGRDTMTVLVEGNDERITLISRFDNLGKGASGAAIQNMNIVLGLPETTGLVL